MQFKKYLLSIVMLAAFMSAPVYAGHQPIPNAACPITDTSPTTIHLPFGLQIMGVHHYGCNDDNINIVWTVSVPDGCDKGGCGIIFDIHGATMNALDQEKGTKLRVLGNRAVRRGASTPYIVAQPNLTDFFDSQGLDLFSVFGDAYVAELPAMKKFIDDAILKFNVDRNRIHVTGFSRGTHTVNEFYCNAAEREKYASFSMHGEILKCKIHKNKPLILTNGIKDWLTPNKPKYENSRVMNKLRSKGFTETLVHQDPNWRSPDWVDGLIEGKYEHRRFTNRGDQFWFESIEHSGDAYPAAGHCFPRTGNNYGWLRCLTTFNVGEKIIDFFIAHPKK